MFISEGGNQYDGRVIYSQSQDSDYPSPGTVSVEITATFTDEAMLSSLALAKMVRSQDENDEANREEGIGLYQSSGNKWFKDPHFLDLVVEVIYPKVLSEKEKLGKVEIQVESSDFELKMLDSPFDSLKVNTARGKISIQSVSKEKTSRVRRCQSSSLTEVFVAFLFVASSNTISTITQDFKWSNLV